MRHDVVQRVVLHHVLATIRNTLFELAV